MRDFLELYNKLTERCFGQCVTNLNNKGLSHPEVSNYTHLYMVAEE